MKQREKVGETAVAGPPQSKTIFLSKIKEDIKNSLLQEYSYIRNVDIVRTLWFPENLLNVSVQFDSHTKKIKSTDFTKNDNADRHVQNVNTYNNNTSEKHGSQKCGALMGIQYILKYE